ncbi:MAG TPA: hypothetical protein VKT25_00010 [Ktedonobacteraceae bacterium]|nr:hypothetical protein [Ktedonobacteraceae bacterium]
MLRVLILLQLVANLASVFPLQEDIEENEVGWITLVMQDPM